MVNPRAVNIAKVAISPPPIAHRILSGTFSIKIEELTDIPDAATKPILDPITTASGLWVLAAKLAVANSVTSPISARKMAIKLITNGFSILGGPFLAPSEVPSGRKTRMNMNTEVTDITPTERYLARL